MKKSIFVLIMLCCCLLFMVACASDEGTTDTPADTDTDTPADTDTEEAPTVELKMNVQDAVGNPPADSAQEAIDAIYEASDGKIVITPYFNQVLGDYLTIYEDLQRGAIDLSSMSLADQFNDLFMTMCLPYAVTSFAQANALYDPAGGAFFEYFKQGCEETNTVLVSTANAGFMGISASKIGDWDTVLDPMIKQEDCLIRVPPMDVYVSLGEAMGFSVTTIAYGDVYSSLQTGVCDGVIGTAAATAWVAFRDVVNYWVDYKYILEMVWIVASENCVNNLPDGYYDIIRDAFVKEYWDSTTEREQQDLDAIQSLDDYGCTTMIPTPEELVPMRDHVREVCWPYYANYYEPRGGQDFIDQLLEDISAVE